MASLTKRKVNGKIYYYLVESQRINGKPRLVKQKYLGRADQVVARLEAGRPTPTKVTVAEYGGSMALLRIAERLRVVDHIDAVAPKRDQGPSVGQYLLVAAINRALAPTSKTKIADWYQRTALYHQFPFRAAELASQRFWDHMGYIDASRIQAIETRLTQHMVREFGLDLETVVYDATNFYTWLDTMTPSELAQRGHQKQHRTDLRAVGLALMVTTDFNIPLFHAVYPGNRADSQEFHTVTEDLIARYRALCDTCQSVTIVYDKGNNSQANQAQIDTSPLHFVGSLKANQVPDLLEVASDHFRPLTGADFGGVTAYRTEREILGERRTVVVTYNEALYLGQWQGELLRLRKLNERLHTIQARLADSPHRRPTVDAVQKRVDAALAKAGPPERHWVTVTVTDTDTGPRLAYHIDHAACEAWGHTHWGKTLLFTDRHDWTTEQIVTAYREAWHIEQTFRTMKQSSWLHWQPQFHWTDDKIRVHAFICVLAVTLVHLLRRECAHGGMEVSVAELLEDLTTIEEVLYHYPAGSDLDAYLTLTERTERQQKLLDLLAIPVTFTK